MAIRVELNFEEDMTFSSPYKMIRLPSSYTVRSLLTRSRDRPLSPDSKVSLNRPVYHLTGKISLGKQYVLESKTILEVTNFFLITFEVYSIGEISCLML